MRDLETTARIRREDLTDLLELERAPSKQRITARMPAVTLTDLLTLQDDQLQTIRDTPRARPRATMRPLTPPPSQLHPPELPVAELPVITFRRSAPQPVATPWPMDRWPQINRGFVIALSASATLVIAHLLSLL